MVSYKSGIGKAWQDSTYGYSWSSYCHVFDKKCGTVVEPDGHYCPFRIAPGYETDLFDLRTGSYKLDECREIGVFIVDVSMIYSELYTQSKLYKDGKVIHSGHISYLDSPQEHGFTYWSCCGFRTYFGYDSDEVQENGRYIMKREFSKYSDMHSPYKTESRYFDIVGSPSVTPPPPPPTGLFGDIGAFFYAIDWLSPVYHEFSSIGDLFYELQTWSDTITDSITEFLGAAGITALIASTYDIVSHSWQDVIDLVDAIETVLPVWLPTSLEDLKTLIEDTISGAFSIVTETKDTIVSAAKTTVLGTYTSIDTWLTSKKDLIMEWVKDLFPYDITDAQALLRWIGIEAGDVITTILDTPADMFAWIKTEIEDAYDIVSHSWQDVIDLVDAIETVLPVWLPTSLEDLKTLIEDTISGAFSIVTETKDTIVSAAKTTVLGTYTSIDTWLTSKKDLIMEWVKDLFPYDITDAQALLRWIGIEAGDVITTILDTPADMFAWIKTEIEDAYDIVTHSWYEVTDLIPSWSDLVPYGFPSSVSDLTSLISSTILGAFSDLGGWFDAQEEKVLNWVVDSFEWILDKVFKE